ncbi:MULTISPECIES: CDP-diacylglycerol--glycerol-3-phosphate 3-phosphatidyltransferase [Thermoanaerobacterium]|uniref:CDP-diacylglycerol--glycerol-3-phosphate 3-phosphatidyltransferase n=1 Tax=Thermoanaerobacterium xylanolyticum (strain ATCC 49914 / DSM 7097 / LX-11) TaxID=858215 RepID=F6BFG3_THEXL|nr:CDP-diacylglycerol--glycerol-3-phosphate 3-phosphatidyltransferase [Thermoanaerobacterium xylanolyticum]AEF17302.1 CDP-diacylglycerol/glycerol-3-phosphate 3-phosphatidyltransferase [Thermoanaerobacterium xylanolyticum LX-11]
MNAANKITIARLILVPFFIIVMLSGIKYSNIIAASLFLVASLTDKLDGYIARKYNQITNLGKFMDPLVDKIMVSSALIVLIQLNRIQSWIVIVILCREFIITGLRAVGADKGIVIAASNLGKYKTTFQIIAIISLMLNNYPFEYVFFPFSTIAVYLALFFTVYSGIDYVVKCRNIILG